MTQSLSGEYPKQNDHVWFLSLNGPNHFEHTNKLDLFPNPSGWFLNNSGFCRKYIKKLTARSKDDRKCMWRYSNKVSFNSNLHYIDNPNP